MKVNSSPVKATPASKPAHNFLLHCQKISANLPDHMQKMGRQVTTFGVVMSINFPLFLLFWGYHGPQDRGSLIMRGIATLLCLGLVCRSSWPAALQKWIPVYWYTTLFFTLPFFFIYFTLANGGDTLWLMNLISAIFFLYLLVDAVSAIVLLGIGTLLAYMMFYFVHGEFIYHTAPVTIDGVLVTFGSAILIASLFSRNRDLIARQKISGMRLIAGSIAHELRTPLASIKFGMAGIAKYLPILLRVYEEGGQSSENKLPPIRKASIRTLNTIPASISREVSRANIIIDGILKNVNFDGVHSENFSPFSMNDVVLQALNRYPFDSDKDKQKVRYHCEHDYMIQGDPDLFVHVLFNLIKNALYFMARSGKGDISIKVSVKNDVGYLIFKDTASGIGQKELPRLFDRFYSKRKGGTGIGLAFCKMVVISCQGQISCDSILGEHTTFTLQFPTLHS